MKIPILIAGALAAVSFPVHAAVIGVYANTALGTVTSAGVLDTSSRNWTELNTTFTLGSITGVSVSSAGNNGDAGSIGNIFDRYRHTNVGTIMISGLDDNQTYNLAFYMSDNTDVVQGGTVALNQGSVVAGLTTKGTRGHSELASPNNNAAFIEDTGVGIVINSNYVTFMNVSTNGAGVISFDHTGAIFNGLEIENIPVPEPSSTALLGLGGLALILRRRKG